MTDAPERIWATMMDPECARSGTFVDLSEYPKKPNNDAVEYTRADLVPQWKTIETAPRDEMTPLARARLLSVLWYIALVLALASVVAWAVLVSATPADASPSPRTNTETPSYTTNWPTECRRWIDLPRAHEHGGVIREWADRVAGYMESGTCVRVTRRANSAALLVLELHELGHLCIAPDARLGFHESESSDWFEPLFRRFPGLWEWYDAGPRWQSEVTYVSGEWFNKIGVPEC